MKLAEWARRNKIHPRTAERWFHNGILPVKAKQLETGTILILEEDVKIPNETSKVAIYARVSTRDQSEDLDRQLIRLKEYCAAKGYTIFKEVKEVASGMNDRRAKLTSLLEDKTIDTIVVEHKDRLTRFGYNMVDVLLRSNNRKIEVMNESECKDDLVEDFIDIITSMCSRIYGKRSAKNKRDNMVKELKYEKEEE